MPKPEMVYPTSIADTNSRDDGDATYLATLAQITVGWDLSLVVNHIRLANNDEERQVWTFDSDTNPITCLLRVNYDDASTNADLLALTVPLAQRFYPSYIDAPLGHTYDARKAV